MQKAAPLIILTESNLAEVAVDTTFLAEQNGVKSWQMSLLSAPGYQNNAYEVTTRGTVVHPDHVLVKTNTENMQSLADREMLRRSNFLEPIHF